MWDQKSGVRVAFGGLVYSHIRVRVRVGVRRSRAPC